MDCKDFCVCDGSDVASDHCLNLSFNSFLFINDTNRSAEANWKIKWNISMWDLVCWHEDKNQRLQLLHNHPNRLKHLITATKRLLCLHILLYFHTSCIPNTVLFHKTRKHSHIIIVCLWALVIMAALHWCPRLWRWPQLVWWINLLAGHVSAFPFAPATQC